MSIQPKYSMKMEAASDSSPTERNCTLLITSYFPNYIYENEPYILANNNTRRRNRRGRMRRNS
ncbi:MAG: hypothetical protein ACJ72J_17810 [Nitrososphaeraceae archaeon]